MANGTNPTSSRDGMSDMYKENLDRWARNAKAKKENRRGEYVYSRENRPLLPTRRERYAAEREGK